MKKIFRPISVLILSGIILAGCGRNNGEEIPTIEQIHQSEGIPVVVEEVSPERFTISLIYNASLTGIRETNLSSLISDRVEEVHVQVGDYVEKDELLISFPEDNPSAQYRQARAAYENSLQTYNRMVALYEAGGISQQEIDQLETAKRVNEANYRAAEKMIRVRAPFNGYVTHINFRETDSVKPGESLITVAQIGRYKATVWVSENDILDIRPGLEAFASWQDHKLPGRVVQVARSIDSRRQAFGVDLEFNNPDDLLLSGVMTSIELFRYDNPEVIVVPRQYIGNDAHGSYVYIARGERARKQYVLLGEYDGYHYEIVEGLSSGDKLIKEGTSLVSDNSLLRITQ